MPLGWRFRWQLAAVIFLFSIDALGNDSATSSSRTTRPADGADVSQKTVCMPWQGCLEQGTGVYEFGIYAHDDAQINIQTAMTKQEMEADAWPDVVRITPRDTCESMGWVPRDEPRRVWDAFTFFKELEVLRLRLRTLAPVTHRFVLVVMRVRC